MKDLSKWISDTTQFLITVGEKVEELEKRIASLESKPSGSHLAGTRINFEGDGVTKVPNVENESDAERLKEKL